MKRTRFQLTLGAMLILVALAAVVLTLMRPRRTEVMDVKSGAGPAAKPGDTLVLHYVGRLGDGREFDNSKGRGEPFRFGLGRGMVIRGWDVGLVGMRVGGVRRLTIPPGDAYGARGVPPTIPANATLYFEAELLKIE
jgi:FKBP-type peptidyl-prolyl cis-trans isomerase